MKPIKRLFYFAAAVLLPSGPFQLLADGTVSDPTNVAATRPDVDEEPDGLTNKEEAEAGGFPYNAYSDGDAVMDGEDAVPNDAAFTFPRLPETRYAILDLGENTQALALNASNQVLAKIWDSGGSSSSGFWYSLWNNGQVTNIPFAHTEETLPFISNSGLILRNAFNGGTNEDHKDIYSWSLAMGGTPTVLVDVPLNIPEIQVDDYRTGSSYKANATFLSLGGTAYYLLYTTTWKNQIEIESGITTEETKSKAPDASGAVYSNTWIYIPDQYPNPSQYPYTRYLTENGTKDQTISETYVGSIIKRIHEEFVFTDCEYYEYYGAETDHVYSGTVTHNLKLNDQVLATSTLSYEAFNGGDYYPRFFYEDIFAAPVDFSLSRTVGPIAVWSQYGGSRAVYVGSKGGSNLACAWIDDGGAGIEKSIFFDASHTVIPQERPRGINSRGEILFETRLWRNNRGIHFLDLAPALQGGESNWVDFWPTAINDGGVIAGTARNAKDAQGQTIPPPNQKSHALMLVPLEMKWVAQTGYDNVEDNKMVREADANFTPIKREWMKGKGSRIFPDIKTPGDSTANRNRCILRIDGKIPNCTVYLKAFDVDDATPDEVDNDPANMLDANGKAGDDNMDVVWARTGKFVSSNSDTATVTLDANGMADVLFETTKQPGDNFRVAAAFKQDDLNVLQVSTPEGNGFIEGDSAKQGAKSFNGVVSPMLTVWRRLWLEFDSMGPQSEEQDGHENFEQVEVGTENAYLEDYPSPGFSTLGIFPALSGGNDRFENGKLYIGATPYVISSNNAAEMTVTIEGKPGSSVLGQTVKAYDDDSSAIGSRQPRSMPYQISGGGLIYTAYADAFIEPIKAPTEYIQNDIPFLQNRPWPGLADGSHKNLNGSADFWSAYLLSAWQPPTGEDGDPDNESGEITMGVSRDIDNVGEVYVEAIRELELYPAQPRIQETVVVVHETGHQGGGDHNDGGIMTQGSPVNIGIGQNAIFNISFTPKTIRLFREGTDF